jgi:hypothetical protein
MFTVRTTRNRIRPNMSLSGSASHGRKNYSTYRTLQKWTLLPSRRLGKGRRSKESDAGTHLLR